MGAGPRGHRGRSGRRGGQGRGRARQLETIQGGYDAWEATETPTLDRGTVAKTALQRRGVAADYGVPPAPEPLTGRHLGSEADDASAAAEAEKQADAQQRILRQLGITEASAEATARLAEAAEKNAAAQAKAEEIQSALMPDEDPDLSPFAAWDADRDRDAILQPPPPEISPVTKGSRTRSGPRRLGSRRMTDPMRIMRTRQANGGDPDDRRYTRSLVAC